MLVIIYYHNIAVSNTQYTKSICLRGPRCVGTSKASSPKRTKCCCSICWPTPTTMCSMPPRSCWRWATRNATPQRPKWRTAIARSRWCAIARSPRTRRRRSRASRQTRRRQRVSSKNVYNRVGEKRGRFRIRYVLQSNWQILIYWFVV